MKARAVRRRGASFAVAWGFTLIEVLVVMSLLSLVMLAMGSALRTTAQTEERIDQRLQRTDELRVASGFLRSILGRVSARKAALPVAEGQNLFIFKAQPQEMSWVGIMPARYGAGGRHHFHLAVEESAAERALVVRFTPWIDDATPPDWNQASAYALVRGVRNFALQYEDADAEPPLWAPQWTVADRLPQRIMLSLETDSGAWPEFVVAMRLLPASDPLSSGGVPTFGGGQ